MASSLYGIVTGKRTLREGNNTRYWGVSSRPQLFVKGTSSASLQKRNSEITIGKIQNRRPLATPFSREETFRSGLP